VTGRPRRVICRDRDRFQGEISRDPKMLQRSAFGKARCAEMGSIFPLRGQ
jgi:hypothetical protein